MNRRVRTFAVSLLTASSMLLATAASAERVRPKKKLTPKAAEVLENARRYKASTAPASSGLKAAKDPDTGEFRAPAAGELRPSATGTGRTTTFVARPDGSVRAYLGDEHLTDLAAVKNADGSVTTHCGPLAQPTGAKAAPSAEVK